ncbi:hypothetical protein [Nitrosospira briensis]|uniref:hypothetical protein n=1 Tax=Nitrosospira briensis TaxID=35799 RepID=UPI0012E1FD7E|nr:hypothetical protein [Nitrosospira briensis]
MEQAVFLVIETHRHPSIVEVAKPRLLNRIHDVSVCVGSASVLVSGRVASDLRRPVLIEAASQLRHSSTSWNRVCHAVLIQMHDIPSGNQLKIRLKNYLFVRTVSSTKYSEGTGTSAGLLARSKACLRNGKGE